jgi:hypothetical protein
MSVNRGELYRESILMAAGLARGDGLAVILRRCEQQKTVSAHVVERDLEVVQDFMKRCAAQMKLLADQLNSAP